MKALKFKFLVTSVLLLPFQIVYSQENVIFNGKTNSALLIHEELLDEISNKLILNEIAKQLAMGKISTYGFLETSNGENLRCVQFKLLDSYNESSLLISTVVERIGKRDAVSKIGSCTLGVIN